RRPVRLFAADLPPADHEQPERRAYLRHALAIACLASTRRRQGMSMPWLIRRPRVSMVDAEIHEMEEIMIRAIGEQSDATPSNTPGAAHAVEWGAIQYSMGDRISPVAFGALRRRLAQSGYLDDKEAYATPRLLEDYFSMYHPLWRQE